MAIMMVWMRIEIRSDLLGTRISELLLVRVHGDRKDAKDDDGDVEARLRHLEAHEDRARRPSHQAEACQRRSTPRCF